MPDFVDPYIDPKTGILRNLVGAQTRDDLKECEADIVAMSELELANIPRTNDFMELSMIHKASELAVKKTTLLH